mmetsp:Transcript_20215/g.37787  ORF Transcript_20215/g.37787 Transcript_20215/m.37787 type:complete len:82 (-) Transcript_20215:85-330(-)
MFAFCYFISFAKISQVKKLHSTQLKFFSMCLWILMSFRCRDAFDVVTNVSAIGTFQCSVFMTCFVRHHYYFLTVITKHTHH